MNSLVKAPPHSVDAERSVLGSILIDPGVFYLVNLKPEEFYRSDHRTIYRAVIECDRKGNKPDLVTVGEVLDADDELENVGGMPYLVSLVDDTPGTANAEAYARVVRERAKLRRLITAGHKLVDDAFSGDLDALSGFMATVANEGGESKQRTFREILTDAVEHIDRAFQDQRPPGIMTGIERFDEKLGGLHDQNLIIVGGRPSMGKSAVMCNIIATAAITEGKSVGVITLEMSDVEVMHRLMALVGDLPVETMRNGKMQEIDWPYLTDAVTKLNDREIHIHEGAAMHIGEVIQVATMMKHRHGINLLMVDYLQLIEGDGSNRNEKIGSVSRALKALAKRLKIPVVAMAQVNREVEKRQVKRPTKADLRDSGEIEQDADVIVMLYRDGYYNEKIDDDRIDLIIEKNRNGKVGTIQAGWNASLMRIENWTRERNA